MDTPINSMEDEDDSVRQDTQQHPSSWKRRVVQYILNLRNYFRTNIHGQRSSFFLPISKESIRSWIKFISTFSTLFLLRELRLQRILSSPPIIFIQQSQGEKEYSNSNPPVHHEKTTALRLKESLTEQSTLPYCMEASSSTTHSFSSSSKDSPSSKALSRIIKPSLFFTSSVCASLGAYLHRGPTDPRHETSFREYFIIGSDGTTLALDWEVPLVVKLKENHHGTMDIASIQHMLLHGPITLSIPIILILHGINNDSSYGYIRSLQRLCTDRGWITCAINFRGCGSSIEKNYTHSHQTNTTTTTVVEREIGLHSPRPYHAGYTNDLRTVINCIVHRCNKKKTCNDNTSGQAMTPIFLVGNSLGANIMTKYLGEEGIDQTLPPNILAGISRGNPLEINGEKIHSPWAQLLALGVKKTLFFHKKNRQAMSTMMMNDIHFQKALWKALLTSSTIGTWDRIMAPFMIRNEIMYPFTNKIGFHNGGEEYWSESSSRKYVANVSIPLLILSSMDDFLVTHSVLRSMNQCLSNPNVMIVKTKTGGHLGWQEAKKDKYFGTCSFADSATVEFIEAVLEDRQDQLFLLGSNSQNASKQDFPRTHSRL